MATFNPRNVDDNQETDLYEVDDGTSSAFASVRLNDNKETDSNGVYGSISSAFDSIRQPLSMSSDEITTRSLPSSYLSTRGFQSEIDDIRQSQISKADTIREYLTELDEENKMDLTEISKENQCFRCKTRDVTHFCKNCKEGRNYICHVCLQEHNYWNNDHDVASLSVDSARITLYQRENIKSSKSIGKYDEIKEKLVISGELSTIGKELSESGKTFTRKKIIGKKFYNDPLFLEIAREEKVRKQQRKYDEKLVKYGKYSVRTSSDKKMCVIVGITQLENKSILLADSENSELKIMHNETFRVTISHKLPNNPYLMCFVEGNKVIVAFINFEFHFVNLTDGIDNKYLFEIKHTFKGIAYANNELFGCTVDTFEVYSKTGQQIFKIKPLGITSIEDMCINREGDCVYCADEMKGIVILDRHGNVLDIISENIFIPYRLCLGFTGDLYVTEKKSERVIKVNPDKMNAKQVEQENVYIRNNPISLCHETANNRLIVALWQSDEVHVYTCP